MIKISALNNDSEEESAPEEEVTKEALEQIALQQYAKALDLQRKGNLRDATQLLNDLLDTELLYDVRKPAPGEKIIGPLLNLKYLCYKNLAAILSTTGDLESAIEAYCSASEFDDTDVTLWHRLGQLCMQVKRYEMALHAFQSGVERNNHHWPCLDKTVKLLLALDYKEECIATIHETLQLDPGYLRGLAYRQYIYAMYPYIQDFMEYLNPIYKWNKDDDGNIDEEKAEVLIKEAKDINAIFLEQQKAEKFKYILPDLKLQKPISDLTWSSVGSSLLHMHQFMSDNFFSHACFIELIFQEEETPQPVEVVEEIREDPIENKIEENMDIEKNVEIVSENENNDFSDKDKATTDTEKVESDIEVVAMECPLDAQPERKMQKKAPVRRRGSALSYLQQWEWCTRRSGRKKPVNRQDMDDNIYDTLRKMIPSFLSPEVEERAEIQEKKTLPDSSQTNKLFEELDQKKLENEQYFGTERENKDVKEFINKYIENKKDIIDILNEYLNILAEKWKFKWPEGLSRIFIESNKCYNTHIDIPACTDNNQQELLHYTKVNILVEEFLINDKLNADSEKKEKHNLSIIESIGMILALKPNIFSGTECLELILRNLWAKLHIHILQKCEEFALDCLYQLLYEFNAMGVHHNEYRLDLINFTFKPTITETEILTFIKFLERNKDLSTVVNLYDQGSYEEVLSIVIDSFEHCKTVARNQEEDMSLDFAVQLSLILDTCWALDKVDECFKWSLICLHEALKHYFRFTTNCPDYTKWSLTVVKILCSMEHILSTEGLSCLDTISQKELSQGLEDLIRIIGHQVETNATDMPLGTVMPWIIIHYILQREEDQGRRRPFDKDKVACDEIPNPLLVLFIGHEQLGNRGWCNKSDGKLLYFILDTVVPRLRSPALAKCLEQIIQYMEQCVYCLFGHPGRKHKLKYLVDHNVEPQTLDWKRAQQLYEIFKPPVLPALEGKLAGITSDTEQLFQRILALIPSECDPQKYAHEVEKYIKGFVDKLPAIVPSLPYKMRDIYFLLGDYYFKKEEGKMAVKYNIIDVVLNNDRLESWAQISLAKAVNLDRLLNSCRNMNNETEFLNPAKAIVRCYKRSLELDPTYTNIRIEYGMFTYAVHSFCSRLLKQASESLSMEDFESLEKQKENMLNTTHRCFTILINDLNNSNDSEKENDEAWLYFYMLGKVSEKRNKAPSVYLDYYMKGVKCLQEIDATYPLKISYNSPTHLCLEVLELHYRIHASILKFIEQHENKPISVEVGKIFMNCTEEWKKGPFSKKSRKEFALESENEIKTIEVIQAANIFKRSISDSGEDDTHEVKRMKLEAAAAKVRRSASYDTEHHAKQTALSTELVTHSNKILSSSEDNRLEPLPTVDENVDKDDNETKDNIDNTEKVSEKSKEDVEVEKKGDSSSESSSSSSSESSSSESSSDSSSDSSRDSDTSRKVSNDFKPISDEDLKKIISSCLDALEDCASRFPQHYKAIYRLAHYHFYYQRGKDIERCRDLMLSNFISRSGQKLGGLFSERKHSNFFNNIWKIQLAEVDRPGGFAFHMSRSVLLTMEILKEIDDHKTLLDLSLHLQRIPEPDKKYLRDSDREELAQQAFSLCVQSLKGQLVKFSQQADLKSNDVERQALKSLMLDIYHAYQRAQKHSQRSQNSKQFMNLLVEAYKLVTTEPLAENINFVDMSLKYCQRMIQKKKNEAKIASFDKSQNKQDTGIKKQVAKIVETVKSSTAPVVTAKQDHKVPTSSGSVSGLPKMSQHEMAAAFQNYLPMLNDTMLSQQTAAALSLSYLTNMSALAGYSSLPSQLHMQASLQNTLQNSFQAEFYRQFLEKRLSPYMPAAKKQKRGPKPQPPVPRSQSNPPTNALTHTTQSKSFSGSLTNATKAAPTPVITSLHKSSTTPLTPSMGSVLPNIHSSTTANVTSYGTHANTSSQAATPSQAHVSMASSTKTVIQKLPQPQTQASAGKTLQEKLAERQKHMPIPKNTQGINSSISKLPSSLTITKTTMPKQSQGKKLDAKKSTPFNSGERPKPITTDEIIILDDD